MRAARTARPLVALKLGALVLVGVLPALLPLWSGGRAVLHWCWMQLSEPALLAGEAANWLWRAPLFLLGVGLVVAALDRGFSELQLRRFLKRHTWRRLKPGEAWYAVARELGVERAIRILEAPSGSPVFTAHMLRPRMYFAQALSAGSALTPAECRAVLCHEAAHLRRRDPLRLAAVRFVGRLLFWLPALAAYEERYRWRLEALADDAARSEGRGTLAAAIVKVVRYADPELHPLATVPALSGPSTVEWRVRRLLGHMDVAPLSGPGRTRLALSGVAVVLLWVSVFLGAAPHDQHHPGHDASTSIMAH